MKNNPISEKIKATGQVYKLRNTYHKDLLADFYDHIAKYHGIINLDYQKEYLINTFLKEHD